MTALGLITAVAVMAQPAKADTTNPEQPYLRELTNREKACFSGNGIITSGHRGVGPGVRNVGGSAYAENTYRSLKKGLSLGMCMVEFDVQPSATDGVFVVQHDTTYTRMTNGTGVTDQRSWSYASRLTGPARSKVNNLNTMLKGLQGTTCGRQVEIKTSNFSSYRLKQLADILKYNMVDPRCYLIASGSTRALCEMKKHLPEVRTARINHANGRLDLSKLNRNCIDQVNIAYQAITSNYVKSAHRLGIAVSGRKVNSLSLLYRMRNLNVDQIVTDRPEIIRYRR